MILEPTVQLEGSTATVQASLVTVVINTIKIILETVFEETSVESLVNPQIIDQYQFSETFNDLSSDKIEFLQSLRRLENVIGTRKLDSALQKVATYLRSIGDLV